MRCKNCGWDNPAGNAKCVKCNAPLTGSMIDEDVTDRGSQNSSDKFNPKQTVRGCPDCGYFLKPNDTMCPNCGRNMYEGKNPKIEPENLEPQPKVHIGGTIIQGRNSGTGNNDGTRRKLVGFLVTYSLSSNGDFFPLYEGKNFIGSCSSQNVHIQGDPKISNKHMSILYRVADRKIKFKDEQSTNSTFINGVLIDDGELKNHDEITIGSTKLIFITIPETAITSCD